MVSHVAKILRQAIRLEAFPLSKKRLSAAPRNQEKVPYAVSWNMATEYSTMD